MVPPDPPPREATRRYQMEHVEVNSALVAALAVRAEAGRIRGWRIFGEAGGWACPTARFNSLAIIQTVQGMQPALELVRATYFIGRIGAI